jgi:hypothetical protein
MSYLMPLWQMLLNFNLSLKEKWIIPISFVIEYYIYDLILKIHYVYLHNI